MSFESFSVVFIWGKKTKTKEATTNLLKHVKHIVINVILIECNTTITIPRRILKTRAAMFLSRRKAILLFVSMFSDMCDKQVNLCS